MLNDLQTQIRRRATALARAKELREQASSAALKVEAAKAMTDTIKSGSLENLASAARELTETNSLIELGNISSQRLNRQADEAAFEAKSAEVSARDLIKNAFSLLARYRQNKRQEALISNLSGWVSPEAIQPNSPVLAYLKRMVNTLSALDQDLDRVSFLSGGLGAVDCAMTRSPRLSNSVEDDARFIESVEAELNEAAAWEAEDQRARVELSKNAPWRAYDPADRIQLYSK